MDTRNNNPRNNGMKGISPVVATILMVMITVVLVAFSFTWFQNMQSGIQQQTGNSMSQVDKSRQTIDISTVYQCGSDICFAIRATSSNTYSIPLNGTSYMINGVPKSASSWDGSPGLSGGSPCTTVSTLVAGGICYGKILSTTCVAGDIFKVATSWGPDSQKSIDKCS
jgi:flagellin-like protein